MQNNELSFGDQLRLFGIGIAIASWYTALIIWIPIIVDTVDYFGFTDFIQYAEAQILPFEQQLEMIRDPQECTRKVVQASSAQIPFTMKVFYDTTKSAVLEIKQQGSTFPITQRTNQVMTFYTNGTDQYEIYMEMNYDEVKPRQIYMEYLSQDVVTYSAQEKFEGTKFCMRIFANTVLPPRTPTKEEIFGEALTYIGQIPSMVTAFNTNTITQATSISYMWMLILGIGVVSVLTFINSISGKRQFNSMLKDGKDSINVMNQSALKIDKLCNVAFQLAGTILTKDEMEKAKLGRQSTVKGTSTERKRLFSKFRKPKKESLPVEGVITVPKEKTIADEIREELEINSEEPKEVATAKVIEEPQEISIENDPDYKLKEQPARFNELVKGIDVEKGELKEGILEKFTYNELNVMYAWITHYRKHMNLLMREIPKSSLRKQEVISDVIYKAIFQKMRRKLSND